MAFGTAEGCVYLVIEEFGILEEVLRSNIFKNFSFPA